MPKNLTVLVSDRFIGKKFTLKDGEIHKTSITTFSSGKAISTYAPDAATLKGVIETLRKGENLCLGVMPDHDNAKVVTDKTYSRLTDKTGVIVRTTEHLVHPDGAGWLLIDFDDEWMPDTVAERIEALGGVEAALTYIWPELSDAEMLVRGSSSNGIYADGIAPKASSGLHVYVLIKDPATSVTALDALQRRAWDAGLGWIKPSKSGQALVRSIVDTSVGTSNRIAFEAPPKLGSGVYRMRDEIKTQAGQALSAPLDAPDVDDLIEAKKVRMRPTLDEIRCAYIRAKGKEVAKKQKMTIAQGQQIVRKFLAQDGGQTNVPRDMLVYDRNSAVVVAEALVKASKPGDQFGLPDPIEGPSYGRTTASLMWGLNYDAPIIVSHAHGIKTIYRLPAPPTKAVWGLTPARLPSRRQKDLQGALQAVRGADDAATVLAVATALSNKIPTAADMDTIRATIAGEIPAYALSDEWIDAILKRVGKSAEHRKRRALAPVMFSLAGRHADDVDHTFVDDLGPLDRIDGVTVVRAPMAKGKTQKVGRPWIKAAKTTGEDVFAIAHRRSLIGELAHRLGLADYRADDPLSDMGQKGGLAVCLPSITLSPWDLLTIGYVFIDEIAQVLRFLTAKEYCRTRDATAAGVFEHLVALVREAKGVLVADAGADDTVLDFIRYCRPGERIRVIEMPDDSDAGIAATFYAGDDKARADAVDEVAAELVRGGKVWVACEGATLAKDVGEHLQSFTDKVLVLTADTKIGEEEAAFFADPEGESRRYDAIIASPVVSSGLSIEHRGEPHFTLGAFLGSGGAIAPADAAQMLRRVRYLDRFAVGVMFNNRVGGQTAEAIIEGREAAAQDEGKPVFSGSFDRLVAGYQAASANARADFAAGLWWQLEAAGWTVTRAEGSTGMFATAKGKIAEDRKAQRSADMEAACDWLPYTTEAEIEDLRRNACTSEQMLLVEAWGLTRSLGVAKLDADDVAFLDDGGLGRIDMFEDLLDRAEDLPEHAAEDRAVLMHRQLRRARRKHLAEIFDGIDVMAEGWLTRDVADLIVDRIMARADAYAASGAVPPRWRSRYGDKPAPRPQNPVKAVQDLLRRAGLGTTVQKVRVVREGPSSLNESGGSRTTRQRIFSLDAEDVEAMRLRAEDRKSAAEQVERNVALLDSTSDGFGDRHFEPHVAHIAEANRIERLKKSGEVQVQVLLFARPSPVGLNPAPLQEILNARNCHARPLTR